MDYIIIGNTGEKFFWNDNDLLEHKESKTTFNHISEAEKWIEQQEEEWRKELE